MKQNAKKFFLTAQIFFKNQEWNSSVLTFKNFLCIFNTVMRRRSQVVRQRSAKPLFTGSNPVAASKKHRAEFSPVFSLSNHISISNAVI